MRWILWIWKSGLNFVDLEKCAGFCVWKSEFESAPGPPTI